MQLVEAIQESPLLSKNGAESLEEIRTDVDEILDAAQRLNMAAWTLVLETKDQVFDGLEQMLEPTEETHGAWNEFQEAWGALTNHVESLRKDVAPPASE